MSINLKSTILSRVISAFLIESKYSFELKVPVQPRTIFLSFKLANSFNISIHIKVARNEVRASFKVYFFTFTR